MNGKPRWLGEVMTALEADEMIATILRLRGDDVFARARAVARGWPLGDGPTMSDDTAKRRQQKGLEG